jgi:predicted GIY-YIG superfamily endonuclease
MYILRCADDSLYVGHTDDLASRERTHIEGHGGKYTSARRPVQMVYAEEYRSLEHALARERQVKRWTATKKLALIAGDTATLKASSRRHVPKSLLLTWRDLLKCDDRHE